MRTGLYFGLLDGDTRWAENRYFGKDGWHWVDFARIAELYRDVDAKDDICHLTFYDTLSHFDLAGPDVADEDVDHGDPAAIPADCVEFGRVFLLLLNWAEEHDKASNWLLEIFDCHNGRYEVPGIYTVGDDEDDDAMLVYDNGDVHIITRLCDD